MLSYKIKPTVHFFYFSYGFIHSKSRNRLETNRAGKLTYLASNNKLIGINDNFNHLTKKSNIVDESNDSDSSDDDLDDIEIFAYEEEAVAETNIY